MLAVCARGGDQKATPATDTTCLSLPGPDRVKVSCLLVDHPSTYLVHTTNSSTDKAKMIHSISGTWPNLPVSTFINTYTMKPSTMPVVME